MVCLQDISKDEIVGDTSQEDDEGVSHDVFPLEALQVIVPVLVYLADCHDGKGENACQEADSKPTGETDEVTSVESDEGSEKCLHTQRQ